MYIQANYYTPCQIGFLRIQVLTEGHKLCSPTMTVVKLEQDQKRDRERPPPKKPLHIKNSKCSCQPIQARK